MEALSTTISRRVSGVTAGTRPLYAVLVVKEVEFESYSMEYGGDVVQYVKVGSPALAIGQHRNGPTICIKARGDQPHAENA